MSWTEIPDLPSFFYRDAGGNGDCMFHSVASSLGNGKTALDIRWDAAGAVNVSNAPDVLMDMAAQYPKSIAEPMHLLQSTSPRRFSPEMAWNESRGMRDIMLAQLQTAISTSGNFCWGDATIASLIEDAENVNVILLASSSSSQHCSSASEIYAKWSIDMLRSQPALREAQPCELVAAMTSRGMTWESAVAMGKKPVRAWRYPVGTVSAMYGSSINFDAIRFGYSASRPTIVLLNFDNAHWVSVGVGPNKETLIHPESCLRPVVDALIEKKTNE